MGRAPHLSLPFLMGILMGIVIAVSVTMYSLQKATSEETINKVTTNFAEQFYHTQSGEIRSYFSRLEMLMEHVRMTQNINQTHHICNLTDASDYKRCTARLYLNQLCGPHNITISSAKSLQFKPKFAEMMIANPLESDRAGDFRGFTYGMEYRSDPNLSGEWEGIQPGRQRHYAIDFTQPTVLPRIYNSPFNSEYDFPENEPVAYLSQKIEGTGFSPTFIYEKVQSEDPEVLSGVFHSFWRNGRLDFYVNLQFSVTNIDNFLQSLKAEYPFSIALLELDSGYIIGDSSPDKPFFLTEGFNGLVNSTEGTQTWRDDRKASRKTFSQSSDPRLRLGGAYVYGKIGRVQSQDVPFTKDVVQIGDEQCSITYGSLRVKNLNWLLFVVVPTAAARGDVDALNTRITIIISVTFCVVCLMCFLMLLWVSRLMNKLADGMACVARLELDSFDEGSRIRITELKRIQLSFLIMVEMIKEYRKYLPQALMEDPESPPEKPPEILPLRRKSAVAEDKEEKGNVEEEKEGGRAGSITSSSTHSSQFLSQTYPPKKRPGALTLSDKGEHMTPSRAMQHIFRVGLFSRRVTMMHITFAGAHTFAQENPSLAHQFGEMVLPLIIEAVNLHEGVVMTAAIDHVVVCWNGHKSVHNHEMKAVQCAIDIVDQFHAEAIKETLIREALWTIYVASGQSVVGTTGAGEHLTPVVLGDVPSLLASMQHLHSYPRCILITDKVKDAVGTHFDMKVVDIICPTEAKKCNLYEVYVHRKASYDLSLYLDGFSKLSSGHFAEAMDHFLRHMQVPDGSGLEPHTVRLYAMAKTKARLGRQFGWHGGTLRSKDDPVLSLPPDICIQYMQRHGINNELPSEAVPSLGDPLMIELPTKSLQLSFAAPDEVGGGNSFSRSSFSSHGSAPRSPISPSHGRGSVHPGRLSNAAGFLNSSFSSQPNTPHGSPKTPLHAERLREEIQKAKEQSLSPKLEGWSAFSTTHDAPVEFMDLNDHAWKRSHKLLGTGAVGEVYLGMGTSGDLVALKIIKIKANKTRTAHRSRTRGTTTTASPAEDPLEEVLQEVSLLSELRDENIVGYVSSCVVDQLLVIVMEYIPGGCLASLLKEFTVLALAATQRYVRDIVRGLVFLHKNGVIHRDVKPHNVLLMIDGQCKLTDFGASARLSALQHGTKGKIQGTPLYMAPEQSLGNTCSSSDVWSVGILTYQLLTGQMPYSEEKLKMNPLIFMYQLGKDETFTPTLGEALSSPVARAFCENILKRDPAQRPTAEDLLNHPFLL